MKYNDFETSLPKTPITVNPAATNHPRQGWKCPQCHTVFSPDVLKCMSCVPNSWGVVPYSVTYGSQR